MSSAPSVKCEICGANCDKMFSTSGNFVLKGSDWPSQGFRTKDEMKKKNVRMRGKMVERESAGEGVTKLSDVK
jgi:predicted nucleic acid-binding Zn ribbon protein